MKTSPYDAVVVGGGHNGLVAAAYLAKGGMRTLVLERREAVGGALELAHTVGRFRSSVVRDLGLAGHGLDLIRPAVRVFAPQPDGRSVTLWADPERTARELRRWSAPDAAAYTGFDRKVRALASFMAYLHAATPPDIAGPSFADAIAGLKLGRAFRALGTKAARELPRAMPIAVADFVGEAFADDGLRAAIAARGVQYAAVGPWSAGTTAILLSDSAGNDGGAAGQATFVRGGPSAFAQALSASVRSFGADIRCGAEVTRITSTDGRATGVALASGEEIPAGVVVSGLDPKRTLLSLVDPVAMGPTLVWRAGNLRMPGVVAKVDLTLDGPPPFAAKEERLRGRIVIAPGIDYLERAFDASKYGAVSEAPCLEATIPSLSDPTIAQPGTHLMSVIAQYAPYHRREGDWDNADRDTLGDLVLKTLEEYAPGLSDRVTSRRVLTPLDLEREYSLTEGHPLHGEPTLDQFFAWRPLLGHSRYRVAIEGLYLCGSGAHPGGGITGAPGANAAREILSDHKHRKR
jgi:phytoene dehydrogenase-like protein